MNYWKFETSTITTGSEEPCISGDDDNSKFDRALTHWSWSADCQSYYRQQEQKKEKKIVIATS